MELVGNLSKTKPKPKMKEKRVKKKIKADYSQFEVGDIFVGIISSFDSFEDSKIFHLVKDDDIDLIKQEVEPAHMWWIPGINETFYVLSEGNYLRCARLLIPEEQLHDIEPSANMLLYLQDTGEQYITAIKDLDYGKIFLIPDQLNKVPGLAVKCIWNEIGVDLCSDTEKTFLQNNIYRKFAFEVTNVSADMLTVNILPYDDNSHDNSYEQSMYGKPFDNVRQQDDIKMILEKTDEEEEEEEEGVDLKLKPIAIVPDSVQKDLMSTKQLETWFEEPLNTGNPQIAVGGFQTNDDKRLCKFFDPEIGGCFKGGRCKQVHLSEIKDGTCRDRKVVTTSIARSQPIPGVATKIEIQVTRVKSIKTLVCRYLDPKTSTSNVDVNVLFDHMNSPNQISLYQPILPELPALKELVIAKVEGSFYRGRVEALTVSDSAFEVLLLDYGLEKKVHLRNMYYWSPRFVYFPFQTFEIVIANIQPFNGDASVETAENKLMELIKESGNCLNAVVVNNFCDIECVLFNRQMEDVGKKLIIEGYVAEKALKPTTTYKPGSLYPG